jgi:hypothetical protein
MDVKTPADPQHLLFNAVTWHVERSAERADLGDFIGARRHRTIADQLLAQLRSSGDAGRRLAAALHERDGD